MAPDSGKLIELEALRGLAAITVFVGHFFMNFVPDIHGAVNGTPVFAAFNGPAAVILFFVLSGFVLTLRSIGTQGLGGLLVPCLKRWPRLSGTVAASSLAYILAAVVGAFPNPEQVISRLPHQFPPILLWGYGRHAERVRSVLWEAAIGTFFNGTAAHNDVLWTMRWELLGSILAFALAASIAVRLRGIVRIAMFAVLVVGSTTYSPYLTCFAVGVAGALFHKTFRDHVRLPGIFAIGMTGCAVIMFSWDIRVSVGMWAWTAPLGPQARLFVWTLAQTTAAVLSMGIALYNPTARGMLRCRAGALAGRMSFAVYLIHLLVICSFTSWLYLLFVPISMSLLFAVGLFGATVVAVFLAAYPLMRFDEWWVGALAKAGDTISLTWPRKKPLSEVPLQP
jgi:peptidoglycan/LPS O-acetylase OafA/YrhL